MPQRSLQDTPVINLLRFVRDDTKAEALIKSLCGFVILSKLFPLAFTALF